MYSLAYFLLPSGGRVISPDGKGAHPSLKEPFTLEILLFLKTLADERLTPNPLSWDQMDDRTAFTQGKLAMSLVYSPHALVVEDPKQSKVAGKVGYAILKLKKMGPEVPVAPAVGWALVMDKNSKAKDASWEFIKYMTSYEAQKEMALKSKNQGTHIKVLEDPEYQKADPSARVMKEVVKDFGFLHATAVTQGTEVERVIHEELQLLFSNRKSPEKVALSLYERIDKVMKH